MKAARFVTLGATGVAAILIMTSAQKAAGELVWKPPKPARAAESDTMQQPSASPSSIRPAGVVPVTESPRATQNWSPNRPVGAYPVKKASLMEPDADTPTVGQSSAAPEEIPAPEGIAPDAAPPPDTPMFAPQFNQPAGGPWEAGPGGPGDACGGPCFGPGVPCDGYCGGPCGPWLGGRLLDLMCNMSFFGGIQGFKGPVDVGQNGNFGFHEGLNFGAPLGDPWGYGYQLGFEAVHSDLSGFRINPPGDGVLAGSSSRNQYFFTGGIFRRVEEGLQGGVVFDYMHDSYYDSADLQQIRSETSIVFGGGYHELGYWGAYGLNRERFQIGPQMVSLQPNDVFAGFYRRYFTGGGQGRLWAGTTGAGQAIIGGEATVPLGTNWALENTFAYVIPKSSPANGGQPQETWSVAISLVWYPGRPARTVFCDPYQPLFGVGDNSSLLVRR